MVFERHGEIRPTGAVLPVPKCIRKTGEAYGISFGPMIAGGFGHLGRGFLYPWGDVYSGPAVETTRHIWNSPSNN